MFCTFIFIICCLADSDKKITEVHVIASLLMYCWKI